ncbi:hypothetical protein HYH03_010629 [Edaphochlamys debaryana]|uniref:Rab-GAP TBC domain-containing protein n=1 Tax=Edaphochlamys debaryana TaxID=47281 RepID=A0A835XTK9_9CHLO|nr:hypothetical protein HYH03_010629 [Edaphochlamys debaryana]|eukprot:KAG2490952.1 hypothetical protein HYH03_010629 [Edaphochlamys debaryana]
MDKPLTDHYGFQVNPDYAELFRAYSPVWEREENEREAHFYNYLLEQAQRNSDGGKFESLEDLSAEYLQDGVTIARAEAPDSVNRRKLEELVHGGIPFTIRGHAWTIFLDVSVRKQKNYYQDLVRRSLGNLQYVAGALEMDEIREQAAASSAALQDAGALHGLSGYASRTEQDLATWRSNSKVWLAQIEKDLPRTFPGLQLMELSGRPALRRVLAAYSLHNSRVGYCQGLNFVAGTLLLFLSEEDAFWCLCALLEDILRGYYDVDMMGMQVDQRVFKRLVAEIHPRLAAHLEALGADVSCVFVQWFLCVFVNFLPIEACLRVWDSLFFHRSPAVLFKTALALLDVFSPALSAATDVLDALDLLQSAAPLTYDSTRLMATAFGPALAGVSDERLRVLRHECREEVVAEAAALAADGSWDAGSCGGSGRMGGDAPAAAPAPQQPPPQSKLGVLKALARGVKEKLTGGGGGGGDKAGSGLSSVERAASPAPEGAASVSYPSTSSLTALAASAASAGGGGGGGGSGGGGGGGGSAAVGVPMRAVTAAADEPLLVGSPPGFGVSGGGAGGAGAADADSEDYYARPGGEDGFQYEQVGYVAPSDLSETASSAAVLVGLPGDEDRSGGGALAAAAAAARPAPVLEAPPPRPPPVDLLDSLWTTTAAAAPPPPLQPPSAATAPPTAAAAAQPRRPPLPPMALPLLPPGAMPAAGQAPPSPSGVDSGTALNTLTSAPASFGDVLSPSAISFAAGSMTADAAPGGGMWSRAASAADRGSRTASVSSMYHETPRWQSIRSYSVTGAAAAAGAAAVAAAAGGCTTPTAAAAAGDQPLPLGELSPQVLMLAANTSQAMGLGGLAEDDDEEEGDGGAGSPGGGAGSDGGAGPSTPRRQQIRMALRPHGITPTRLRHATSAEPLPLPLMPTASAPAAAPATAAAVAPVAPPPAEAAAVDPTAAAGPAAAPSEPSDSAARPPLDSNASVVSAASAASASSSSLVVHAADFSQVQAADQARRAQGGKKTTSSAAKLAWEIAVEPLRRAAEAQHAAAQHASQQAAQQASQQAPQGPLGRGALPTGPTSPATAGSGGGGPTAAGTALSRPPTAPGGGGGGMPRRTSSQGQGQGHGQGPAGAAAAGSAAHSRRGSEGEPSALAAALAAAPGASAAAARGGPHSAAGTSSAGGTATLNHPLANGGGGGPTATPAIPVSGPPPGSSLQSTSSASYIMDEHREASPAEARDDWVIMAAPAHPSGPGPGRAPHPHPHAHHSTPGPRPAGGFGAPHGTTFGGVGGGAPGGEAAAGPGAAGPSIDWRSPGDGGVRLLQDLRDSLGVTDLHHHSAALAGRLGALTAAASLAGAQRPAPGGVPPAAVSGALEGLSDLQQMLDALATGAAPPDPASASAAAELCREVRSGLASTSGGGGGGVAAAEAAQAQAQQRERETWDLLRQYGVLAEVLTSRLDEVVRQLAERQYTVDKLNVKLHQTMQRLAGQDDTIADLFYQQQQQGSSPGPAAPANGGGNGGGSSSSSLIGGIASALGGGGGGGAGGSEPGGGPGAARAGPSAADAGSGFLDAGVASGRQLSPPRTASASGGAGGGGTNWLGSLRQLKAKLQGGGQDSDS